MSKNWIILTGLLFLGAAGSSQAHPLDSPDVVYIDGLPCNRACQSYMAWSWRRTSSATQHAAPVESTPIESPPVEAAPEKPSLRPAKRAVGRAAAVRRESSKPAAPRTAKPVAPLPSASVTTLPPATPPPSISEPVSGDIAASPAANDASPISKPKTVQEQVAAATALAEQATIESATPAPRQEPTNAEVSVTGTVDPGNPEPTASTATDNRDSRVAVLMARPEIESVSDLAGKDVAIEDRQSASTASIRTAITSAGAAEVQLDEKNAKAIDRLVGGEVPAAVVALVSPEAAEWFPEIPGYRIFRIPLVPGASKARL
jgi:hypothetical protein